MNIQFVANRFPYPSYRCDKLKIFNLAKQLFKRHDLYLITFIQDKKDYEYMDELKKYFEDIRVVYPPKYKSVLKCFLNLFSSLPFQISYFQSVEFRNLLNRFVMENEIDVIHTQHPRMAQYTYDMHGIKRKIVEENFGWNSIAMRLEKYCYSLSEQDVYRKQLRKVS